MPSDNVSLETGQPYSEGYWTAPLNDPERRWIPVKSKEGVAQSADEADANARLIATEAFNRAMSGDTAAMVQLEQGLAQARQMQEQTAATKGANPSAGRAAIYAGGEQRQQGVAQKGILQAQEIESARADLLGTYQQTAGTSEQRAAAKQAADMAALQLQLRREAAAQQQRAIAQQQALQVAAATASAAGTAGAAIWSDRRVKIHVSRTHGANEDALIARLGRYELERAVRRS